MKRKDLQVCSLKDSIKNLNLFKLDRERILPLATRLVAIVLLFCNIYETVMSRWRILELKIWNIGCAFSSSGSSLMEVGISTTSRHLHQQYWVFLTSTTSHFQQIDPLSWNWHSL